LETDTTRNPFHKQGMRKLGPRRFTAAANGASAVASLVLGHATTSAAAFGGVFPMALGAGKTQPTVARLATLAAEQGVPQGQLAAERSTLTAVVRVISPALYAGLFSVRTKNKQTNKQNKTKKGGGNVISPGCTPGSSRRDNPQP
jgi:hypothetical protein